MALKRLPRSPKVWFAARHDRDTSMTFFRTVSSNEAVPSMTGAGVTLRPPHSGDFAEWAALRETSWRFLVTWGPIWPADELTRGASRLRLKLYAEDQRSDLAYAFLI